MQDALYEETLPNGVSLEMIRVEGGRFLMGSKKAPEGLEREQPAHEAALDTFYIGKYPVTQSLWISIMGSDNNPSAFKGDRRPLENVSSHQAQSFIQQLNQRTNKTYRLPTEAEWEYAARGGKQSRGYQYAGSDKLEEVGWFNVNSDNETKTVGLKAANELGLFDMSGNVYEWCLDWFSDTYYQECYEHGVVSNPQGAESGVYQIFRGGCWHYDQNRCRATYRHHDRPHRSYYYLGFRLVLPCT